MRNKINISIPKPCHENWQEMSTAEKGRFCSACQKTVYDFTHSSDRQIVEKFNSESNLCGRFLKTQLERDLRLPKEKNSIWIAGVSGILSFLSLGNQEVFAQVKVKVEQTENKLVSKEITSQTNKDSEMTITGTVLDEDKLPIPGILVSIKGGNINTRTDLDGNFSINAKKGDELEYSSIGFITQSKIITKSKERITLIMEEQFMGEIVEERTFFGRIFHSIGNIFR